jgi:hypothetical protein
MIIIAFAAPFLAMWFAASQMSGGGGGGGGGSTVGFGVLLLLAAPKSLLQTIDWRRVGEALAVFLPLPLVFLGMLFVVGPLTTIFAFITLALGFGLLPFLGIMSRPVDRVSGGLARLFLKLGLLGYNKPVFRWTASKYELVDASELDLDEKENVKWYGLAGSLLGFTFAPGRESWGAEFAEKDELRSKQEAVADGGQPLNSNIPAGYTRAPSIRRASSYAGFLPQRLRSDSYYIHSGIAQSRFNDSATGEKSLQRLQKAKEVHGESSGLSDNSIMKAMLFAGTVSSVLGAVVFFL